MTTILRIDASSRPAFSPDGAEGSYSRELGDRIVEKLGASHPGTHIISRDVAADPIPHIADNTIRGFYVSPDAMTPALREATALSDQIIAEIQAADAIVVTAPIYNFAIPSALKAWIDQLVRIGRTFAYENGEFRGLVSDKPTYLALAYGAPGYGPGGPLEALDHLKPYLTMIFGFIGIISVHAFAIEATTADPETVDAQRQAAMSAVNAAFVGAGDRV